MIGKIILFILFGALIVYVGTGTRVDILHTHTSSALSATAPDFLWQSIDGTVHTLEEFKGRPVVLHFWASWCKPCRTEFPALIEAANQVGKQIVFLTISSDETKKAAEQFISAYKSKAPSNVYYAFDPKRTLTYDIFQTTAYPETILMDSIHHLRHKFSGAVDWNSDEAQNYLRQLQ